MPNFVNNEEIFQVTDIYLFQSNTAVFCSIATCFDRSRPSSGYKHNI